QPGPYPGGPYGQPYPSYEPRGNAGPPNYGAPPGWTPATTPQGNNQPWRPSWDQPEPPAEQDRPQDGTERRDGPEWNSGR
ncbi:hypothetical protein, partial [Actinophytocola sp.]|uniref:hypothetical protein n=1 Tax=Actinophytocola sp. TaxID=1872138 RepID=UPI002D5E7F53